MGFYGCVSLIYETGIGMLVEDYQKTPYIPCLSKVIRSIVPGQNPKNALLL